MAESRLDHLVSAVHADQPSLVPTAEPALAEVTVRSITQDSRAVVDGSLFCAVRGHTADGHDWIDAAGAAGAVAVVAEEVRTRAIPTVLTPDSRRATAHFASEFFGRPSTELDLIGVTGTNGKTTIVTLIQHVARSLGRNAESMGTLTGSLTTSAAPQFQESLRRAADGGVDLVAAEVSSHALDQRRVDASVFRLALFTNLTQDHLDYHVDMDHYFAAKALLFTSGMATTAIIDVSSPFGQRMADVATMPVRRVDQSSIDVRHVGPTGSRFVFRGHAIDLPLGGRFNITNAVLVIETFLELGADLSDIATALEAVPQVPGRFEWIDGSQPFGVVVDYSHTPASLEAAIASAREISTGRVIVVFGAGGERDQGKRPLMGGVAMTSDVVIVTSDNPRTEDPEQIIDAIMEGAERSTAVEFRRDADREHAIRAAIGEARMGDVVLIAGKGHENYQVIGSTVRDFDDRVVARRALVACGWDVGS